MSSLYRFTSIPSLMDIVQRQALTMVYPKAWNDPYESFVFAALRSADGRNKVRTFLLKRQTQTEADNTLSVLSVIEYAYFGQCWTRLAESDALWRIYSHEGMSIRIEIDTDDVRKLIDVKLGDLDYVDKMDLNEEIQALYEKNFMVFQPEKLFLKKRRAFEHEKESRILCNADISMIAEHASPIDPAIDITRKEHFVSQAVAKRGVSRIEAEAEFDFMFQSPPARTTKLVTFSHISNFIKSVMLNPFAPSWLDLTLSKYCETNRLPYLGKSSMYQLEV